MATKAAAVLLTVPGPDGDREVRLTSPDKIYFPEPGITKREVVEYYLAVVDPLLRVLRERPTNLKRYPDVMKHVATHNIPLEQGAREHYEMHGRSEGRILDMVEKPEPAPDSYYFMYRNIRLEGFRSP